MPDDKRLDLDDEASWLPNQDQKQFDVMKDVAEATRIARERKQAEKAKAARKAQAAKDRPLMMAIIVFAALVIFAIAYWKTFNAPVQTNNPPAAPPVQTQQAQPGQQPSMQYVPQQPAAPQVHQPRPVPTPGSAPAQQPASENYDQGDPDSGM